MYSWYIYLIFTIEVTSCHRLSGTGYISYPAVLKQATIWHNVLFIQKSAPWPRRNLTESEFPPAFATSDPCPTLHAPGDELPEGRVKLNRAVGSVGKVKFISNGRVNPYTGVFQGATHGIVRISTFLEPVPDCDNCTDPNFGMGLKFLRSGVESASLVAIVGLDGQKSWNVFKNSWSNHPPPPKPTTTGLSLALVNAQATTHFGQVGLSDWARYGENGKQIPDDEVNFPFKLVFRPTGDITFPDEYHGLLADDLATIDKDVVLWDVYAWDKPIELGGREELIGSLILTSPLVPSLWGDTKLFFRHQDMRDDFKLRPEWEEVTPSSTLGLQKLGINVPLRC